MKIKCLLVLTIFSSQAMSAEQYLCTAEHETGFSLSEETGSWVRHEPAEGNRWLIRRPSSSFEIYVLLGWAASPDFLLVSEKTGKPHAACSNQAFGKTIPVISCDDGGGGDLFRMNVNTLRFTIYRSGSYIRDSGEQQPEILRMGSCQSIK